MTAAQFGHCNIVERVIAKGYDVNTEDKLRHRNVPLIAADQGQTETGDLLIAGGANVNAMDL